MKSFPAAIAVALGGLALAPALADDVYWDPNTTTAGDQGGTGPWSVGSNFWTGVANAPFTSDGTENAIFRTTGGTVTMTQDLSAAGVDFQVAGYTLSASANRVLTTPSLSGVSLTKSGTGVVTINGGGSIVGHLGFSSGVGAMIFKGDLAVGDARFSGAITAFDPVVLNRGIHFDGGGSRAMTGKITAVNFNDDIVLGARNNTTVTYSGAVKADQSNDFNLALVNGGKVVFSKDADFDLINNAYFTRQFWVYGDGTGTMELAADLVADKTNNGTTDKGYGAFRLGNATLITHHTQSLPEHVRPSPTAGPGINGHMIFTNQAGGTWKTATSAQTYRGGVWIYNDATIETDADLTHTGVINTWSDYTNHGAFQTLAAGTTITKKGTGQLILAGEQAYQSGASIAIDAGTVVFQSDAIGGTIKEGTAGQNLGVDVGADGAVDVQVSTLHLRSFSVASGAVTRLAGGTKIEATDAINLGGAIDLQNVSPLQLTAYTPVDLLTGSVRTGVFESVLGIDPGGGQALAVTYTASSAQLTLALAGDVNLDGVADAIDLGIITGNLNQPGTWSTGDVTGDGMVTNADAAIIPEPAALGLLGGAVALSLRRRRG